MTSWITQFIGIVQDLTASIAAHLDLHNPTCIVAVGGAFVLLFVVARMWTHASK